MLEKAGIAVLFLVLTVASWRDLKSRRIESVIWYPAYGAGIILLGLHVFNILNSPSVIARFEALRIVLSILMLTLFGFLFWYLGLFGLADTKAFVAIGILVPLYPDILIHSTSFPLYETQFGVFSLSVVANGLILTLLYPFYLGVRNSMNGYIKFPWMFLTVTREPEDIEKCHGKMATSTEGLRFDGLDLDDLDYFFDWKQENREIEREAAVETFLDNAKTYSATKEKLIDALNVVDSHEKVRVVPGLPLIVSLYIGLIFTTVFGDPFGYLLMQFL